MVCARDEKLICNKYVSGHSLYFFKELQWNLSITALRIKDTSVIQTVDKGPERSAIETCTYLTSELRTPLYSVKRTDFAVLLVPRLYKIHSILRTLAGLSHKIVQHCRLIH